MKRATTFRGGKPPPANILSSSEAQRCNDVFVALDRGTGELPLRHLRSALQRLGIYPAEDDLFQLISEYDTEGQGWLSLQQFKALVAAHRNLAQSAEPMDTSMLDAFVALGGNKDQSGQISTEKLRHVVMNEFVLPIDIDKLIEEADSDHSGFIDFEEFTTMLSHKSSLGGTQRPGEGSVNGRRAGSTTGGRRASVGSVEL